MSTKIYEAWRMPIARLTEFIDIVREAAFDGAVAHVRRWSRNLTPKPMPEGLDAGDVELVEAWETYSRGTQFIENTREGDVFHLDLSLGVWLHDDGRAYVIPFLNAEAVRTKVQAVIPTWAEEYAYWNNTDRPEEISAEEWEARAATWREVCVGYNPDRWHTRQLVHTILNTSRGNISRFWLEERLGQAAIRAWREKNKK